jgi:HNH endonuclease
VFEPAEIISYLDMCREEGVSLQRGMNFHLHGARSVILMSLRRGAPYADRVEEDGRVIIYEGHDIARTLDGPNPKTVDQPMHTANGRPTQNALFFQAAQAVQASSRPEVVHVYEKIRTGIWVFNGTFLLTNAWQEASARRQVFKFRLELSSESAPSRPPNGRELDHSRVIPTPVKLEVWRRDGGRCVRCGSTTNLHFDHIIPFSRGGSSLVAENIQLLCARHNLEASDHIH